MNDEFVLEDVVEFSNTGRFAVFTIKGEIYRIWFYTDSNKKFLQKMIDDEMVDIAEFE